MSGFFGGGGPRKLEVRYRYQGAPVVSVTQVVDLCGYGSDYSQVPAAVLASKAGVGSSVHRIAAGTASIADHVGVDQALVDGYFRLLKDTRAEVIDSEVEVVRATHAGTRDQVLAVGGRRVLVDYKTRPVNPCADPVQLGGYDDLSGVKFAEHWLVELKTTRRGYRVHIYEPVAGVRLWRVALSHVRHLYAHRKWEFAGG